MSKVPILRTSERKAAKACLWAWWQRWRMGLVPLGTVSDALWFGTGVHIALANWYCGPALKRGPHPAETFGNWADGEIRHIKTSNRLGNAAEAFIEEKLVPAAELGRVLLEGYVAEYGRDDSWSIIRPEYSGQIDVADPDYPEEILVIYAFTYDLLYRDLRDTRIKLEEHKTAKTISTNHLKLDDQAGSYWAIADQQLRAEGVLGSKERIWGIEYNFIRKAMPDERPRNAEGLCLNKNGTVSKLQPKPLYVREQVHRTPAERAAQIRRIQNDAIVLNAFRDGDLPLTKNPTRECSWCAYLGLCELDEGGHDTEDYRRAMYRVQDPYADHRKSTEE